MSKRLGKDYVIKHIITVPFYHSNKIYIHMIEFQFYISSYLSEEKNIHRVGLAQSVACPPLAL